MTTPPRAPVPLWLLIERRFIPDCCARKSARWIEEFRAAARLWGNALGRDATTDDFSVPSLAKLCNDLRHARYPVHRIRRCRSRLRGLWRYAHRIGLAPRCEPVKVDAVPVLLQLPSAVRRDTPPQVFSKPAKPPKFPTDERLKRPAEPGTLRHLFTTGYIPQRLMGKTDDAIREHVAVHRQLLRHYGRDILIGEQSNALLADHLAWIYRAAGSAYVVNKHRACWFAQWRFAHDQGLIATLPRFPKMKVEMRAPDAWTLDEMKRLLAVATPWWKALLLVGYYSLQRRRALFGIPAAHVDFDQAWIDFPPSSNKTSVGPRCRIGPDCIAALREIWPTVGKLIFERPPAVHVEFRKLLKAAGVRPSQRRNGQFHKLRRTGATHACARGGLSVVSTLLGHSSVYVTLRYIDQTQLPAHDTTRLLPQLLDVVPPIERTEP